jgi:hypothetical protein
LIQSGAAAAAAAAAAVHVHCLSVCLQIYIILYTH